MLQELHTKPQARVTTRVPDRQEQLIDILEKTKKLLPEQGPIGVFVHHNTLHHFENHSFEDATESMAHTRGAEPYMSHRAYVDSFVSGRISAHSLNYVITQNQSEGILKAEIPAWVNLSDAAFYRKLLLTPSIKESSNTIDYLLSEGDYLRNFIPQCSGYAQERIRAQAEAICHHSNPNRIWTQQAIDRFALESLWSWLSENVNSYLFSPHHPPVHHHGFRVDHRVNERLITFLSAYTDQGISYWHIPYKQQNLLDAFIHFIQHGEIGLPNRLRWVNPQDLRELNLESKPSILLSLLDKLGIDDADHETCIQAELLKLPGWSGTVALFEANPTLTQHKHAALSLLDLMIIRLLLLRQALTLETDDTEFPAKPARTHTQGARLELFLLFQSLGIGMQDLTHITPFDAKAMITLLNEVDDFKRRRILHQAYEHTHKTMIMNAVFLNAQRHVSPASAPHYQALFCIDDREESLRRHLEETEPHCETLGVAGFFGLDIRYKGINDHHAVPLCPAAMQA
ncbi:MAG: Na-translocating system protein MpsB, partial [Gammaproteobacteria bacterium]